MQGPGCMNRNDSVRINKVRCQIYASRLEQEATSDEAGFNATKPVLQSSNKHRYYSRDMGEVSKERLNRV
jgi:hypothetical protein